MTVTLIDIIYIITLLFFSMKGVTYGLMRGILSLGTLLIAFLLTTVLHIEVAARLTSLLQGSQWVMALSYVLTFIVSFSVLKLIERWFFSFITQKRSFSIERLLGLLFGLTEGVLISAILTYIFQIQPLFSVDTLFQDSVIYPLIIRVIPLLNSAGQFINIPG